VSLLRKFVENNRLLSRLQAAAEEVLQKPENNNLRETSPIPKRSEQTVARQIKKVDLGPITSLSQLRLSARRRWRRDTVSVQVASSLLADKLPAICGNGTFPIVVSRISMKAASVTTIATAQGLYLGFHAGLPIWLAAFIAR
jgi:hypothetical protein